MEDNCQFMKNTLIIILLILLILGGAWYVFKSVQKSENEIRLEADKEKLQAEFSYLEKSYQIRLKENTYLEAELLKSRAVVKRSEDQLNKAKANEKVYLKRIKEQTLAMSEIQADSVIKNQLGPDSVSQKVVMKLAELRQCDSVRESLSRLNESYSDYIGKQDSLSILHGSQILISRDQIFLLQSSSQIDKQLLQIKDKENKKLRRGKRLAILLVPVAFVVGLLVN